MVDFLEYSGADFLLFAPATYWRLFEQLNGAVWPLQPLLVFVSALLCIVAGSVWRRAGLVVGFFLATFWTVVAQLFFATYYQPINWAVAWVTPVV